jgi:hypothetical protein
MDDWELTTPTAIFVFNRPDKTREVLQAIAEVEPTEVLVVADGPRDDHPDDERACRETRRVVEERVDWDCDLRRNYSDENLGLRKRFATGLEWIFEEVPESIILEDDCVPDPSFFRFCQVMLEEFRDDERVMDVTGRNQLGRWKDGRQDYHFSNYGGVWGWATWRRAWEWYDPSMSLWEDEAIRERIRDVIANDDQYQYLEYIYEQVYRGEIETWDYQWGFARHINSGLSVVPSRNLVSNIGFDESATNTTGSNAGLSGSPRYSMEFPLEMNDFVAIDRAYDREFHQLRPVSHRFRSLRLLRDLFGSGY